MKEKTKVLVSNKLDLIATAVKENNKMKCIEIYNSIPGTGFSFFIDELVNRGLARIEGAMLKFSFED